jgi:hypothetical protein
LLADIVERFGIKDILDNLGGLGENPSIAQMGYAVAPLLPKILKELPGAVGEFVAVCMIPKQKLCELYDEEGGIQAEKETVIKDLLFNSDPIETTHALAKFLSCLRIEDLGNEMKQVAEVFRGLTTQEQPKSRRRQRKTG